MGMYDQDERGSSGGGLSGRLIIAVLIALFGLFMYFTQSEENPITGEKQHISITPDQEIRLGLQSAPIMAQKMGGEVPPSDPRAQEVQLVGQYVLSRTEAHNGPWKFRFHLLADNHTINAFALPGGQIFITLGLYNKLQNEAQLAGVLSHEMGHVIERHSAQQMATSKLGDLLVVAVGVGANQNSNEPAAIAALVNHMFQLKYSRSDEAQADLWGVKLMEKSGYNPEAMIDVLKILKASGGEGHMPEMFQTHPNPDRRIEQIQEYLKEHPPAPGLKEGKKLNG